MSVYFIRPLTRTDEPFLWEMLYHVLYVPDGCAPFDREVVNAPEIARYVSQWGREGDEGFVAVETATSKAIGAVWARLFSARNRSYGYVDDETPELAVALLPEYRNKGIGSDLLKRLIEEAKGRHKALSLSVTIGNPAARLYQRLGFEVVEQDGGSQIMKKNL